MTEIERLRAENAELLAERRRLKQQIAAIQFICDDATGHPSDVVVNTTLACIKAVLSSDQQIADLEKSK